MHQNVQNIKKMLLNSVDFDQSDTGHVDVYIYMNLNNKLLFKKSQFHESFFIYFYKGI